MASAAPYLESPAPSFLFDLDGTLIDSVYQHVIAWRTALMRIGIDLSVWRIHRRIGMSGGLFVSALPLLGLPEDTPMVTRDLVRHAKPDPDLFLAAAAALGVDPRYAMVVGDSVWDLLAARRAGALGVGLMSGGYGREELERAGAYRVYAEPGEGLGR